MRFVVTNIDVDPLSVSFEVVRQGGVELVLVGLVSHVPDGVVVGLNVEHPVHAGSAQASGHTQDNDLAQKWGRRSGNVGWIVKGAPPVLAT